MLRLRSSAGKNCLPYDSDNFQFFSFFSFYSPWPEGLETDEKIDAHFPLKIITSDYCHASPTIRDPRARVVEIKFKLSLLELDEHSRDKMLRLLDKRYDPETDIVTITTDSCPLRKQNLEYALYQLTACYFESWVSLFSWTQTNRARDLRLFFLTEKRGMGRR